MPKSRIPHELTLARREFVAQLRLRGATIREIAKQAETKFVNPETNEPFTHQTVAKDLKALAQEWKENAAGDFDEHRGRQLAEIEQVKRAAWATNDLRVVLNALKQEAEIRGTNAPTKHALTDPTGTQPIGPLVIVEYAGDESGTDES